MFNPFKKKYNTEELSLFRFMSQIKHFEKLTYEELSHFAPYLYLRTFKQDEVVQNQSDPIEVDILIIGFGFSVVPLVRELDLSKKTYTILCEKNSMWDRLARNS